MARGRRRPFDPTLKALVELSPADWLPLLGLRRRRVQVVDADAATAVSGAADKVIFVHDDPAYLLHLDFQAGHDGAFVPRRLKLYNGLLEYRHDCPVVSAAVLLGPEADSPRLTGLAEAPSLPGQEPISLFRYRVVRVWQVPVEQLLSGGVGTLALAPISDVAAADLPDVVRRMRRRLDVPEERARAPEVWAATFLLLGSR